MCKEKNDNNADTFIPMVEPSSESLESARKWREFYIALTRVGFTGQQAMQIIIASQMSSNR